MSIEAMEWARRTRTPGQMCKAVLRTLADYADVNGSSYYPLARIAEDCEISESTLRRRLKQLHQAGLIARVMRRRADGARTTDLIVLLLSATHREYAISLGWSEAQARAEPAGDDADEGSDGADVDGEDGSAPPVNLTPPPPVKLTGGPCQPWQGAGATAGACKDSVRESDSPQAPRGVGAPPSALASGPDFAAFERLWPFGALDLIEPARKVFARLGEEDRYLAVKWAPAFLQQVRASGSKRMSAANWLRGKGWQAFHVKPESAGVGCVFVRCGTAQWFAWEAYHAAAKDVPMKGGKLMAFDTKLGKGRTEKSEWPPTRPPLPLGDAGREAPS